MQRHEICLRYDRAFALKYLAKYFGEGGFRILSLPRLIRKLSIEAIYFPHSISNSRLNFT